MHRETSTHLERHTLCKMYSEFHFNYYAIPPIFGTWLPCSCLVNSSWAHLLSSKYHVKCIPTTRAMQYRNYLLTYILRHWNRLDCLHARSGRVHSGWTWLYQVEGRHRTFSVSMVIVSAAWYHLLIMVLSLDILLDLSIFTRYFTIWQITEKTFD